MDIAARKTLTVLAGAIAITALALVFFGAVAPQLMNTSTAFAEPIVTGQESVVSNIMEGTVTTGSAGIFSEAE